MKTLRALYSVCRRVASSAVGSPVLFITGVCLTFCLLRRCFLKARCEKSMFSRFPLFLPTSNDKVNLDSVF